MIVSIVFLLIGGAAGTMAVLLHGLNKESSVTVALLALELPLAMLWGVISLFFLVGSLLLLPVGRLRQKDRR